MQLIDIINTVPFTHEIKIWGKDIDDTYWRFEISYKDITLENFYLHTDGNRSLEFKDKEVKDLYEFGSIIHGMVRTRHNKYKDLERDLSEM